MYILSTSWENKAPCFGRLTCSKYLLGVTENGILCCWNLLSCALEWSTKLNVRVMEPDPNSENIAAIAQSSVGSDLFVFKPSEPRPLYIQKNICREEVLWGVFVPSRCPWIVHLRSLPVAEQIPVLLPNKITEFIDIQYTVSRRETHTHKQTALSRRKSSNNPILFLTGKAQEGTTEWQVKWSFGEWAGTAALNRKHTCN